MNIVIQQKPTDYCKLNIFRKVLQTDKSTSATNLSYNLCRGQAVHIFGSIGDCKARGLAHNCFVRHQVWFRNYGESKIHDSLNSVCCLIPVVQQ